MDGQSRPPSKLAYLPPELIELIFHHHRSHLWHPVYLRNERFYFRNLSLVCKQWTPMAQKQLWKYIQVSTHQHVERVVNSPVFRQHSITRLDLGWVDFKDAVAILGAVKSLKELKWAVKTTQEATWWNNENLAGLEKLSLNQPLVLPACLDHHFQLTRLSIRLFNSELKSQTQVLQRLLETFASTIEVIKLMRVAQLPSWLDPSKLPSLRVLHTTLYYQPQELSPKDLHGFTHIRFDSLFELDERIFDLRDFPSTIKTIEIFTPHSLAGREKGQPKDFSWPSFFRTPFGKHGLVKPLIKLIRLIVPRGIDPATGLPSHEEWEQIGMSQDFWKEHGVRFDVEWMD